MKTLIRSILLPSLLLAGSIAAADEALTERNRELVVDFYNEVLFEGNLDAAEKYIGDVYIQHNPNVGDGRQTMVDFFKKVMPPVAEGQEREPFGEIVRVIAEDNMVVLHVRNFHWPHPERGGAVVDIFRVENGKIVEHWDVMQEVPEITAHDNGMF